MWLQATRSGHSRSPSTSAGSASAHAGMRGPLLVWRELGTEPVLVAPRQMLSRRQQESVPLQQCPFSHSGERPQQQQQATPASTLLLQTALGVLGRRAPTASNLRSVVL